jgi:hypothetical protein
MSRSALIKKQPVVGLFLSVLQRQMTIAFTKYFFQRNLIILNYFLRYVLMAIWTSWTSEGKRFSISISTLCISLPNQSEISVILQGKSPLDKWSNFSNEFQQSTSFKSTEIKSFIKRWPNALEVN